MLHDGVADSDPATLPARADNPEGVASGAFSLLQCSFGDTPMAEIFSEGSLIQGWLDVEAALARTQGALGLIPLEHAEAIADACYQRHIDRQQLWAETANVGYPILPLVRAVASLLPPGPDGCVHLGATTQDIMDSALARQLAAAVDRITDIGHALGEELAALAIEHLSTVMVGRTHAQQALPITLGSKLAIFLAQLDRALSDLATVRERVAVVSLHGAVGTSAGFGGRGAELRQGVAARLRLQVPDGPWHVARDGLVAYGAALASLATLCLRLAREVIDLSRSEVGEVREGSGHHRGASSTMPQKANPIDGETTIGFAAAASSYMPALYRSMEAGHERAAGEWQIEWHAIPQISVLTAGALKSAVRMLRGLEVDQARMDSNLHLEQGRLLSEAHMLRLAEKLGREEAHDLVYAAALRSRTQDVSLETALVDALGGEAVPHISPADYLGDAPEQTIAAVAAWNRGRDRRTMTPTTTTDDDPNP